MYFHDKNLGVALARADVVVFDMNGTIVDDEPVQHLASNEILSRFGVSFDEDQFIARCVGIKTRTWLSAALPEVKEEEITALLGAREDAYARLVAGDVRNLARPGVADLMRFVSEQPGKKLALATSSPRRNADVILGPQGLGVIGLFDFIITGEEVKKAKPDPEMYQRVRAAFPAAREFLVVEDTSAGIASAKAADMTCLAFPSAYTRRQNHTAADMLVDSLLPSAQTIRPERKTPLVGLAL